MRRVLCRSLLLVGAILELDSTYYFAARGPLLAVACSGDESLELLRGCLGTAGRGRLPAMLAERLGEGAAQEPFTLLAMGHALSEVAGSVAIREVTSTPVNRKPAEIMARGLQAAFGGTKGVWGLRVVVDAKGTRMRSAQ